MGSDELNASKVSIVIPAYNAEKFIGETIEYMIAQTSRNWEMIIVDDLSQDNTQAIVRQYEKADDRIKLLVRDREPKGAQTCRNIGIQAARGKYIMVLDADDIIRPWCVEQRLSFMENHDVDFAVFPGANYNDLTKSEDHSQKWGRDPGKDVIQCFLSVHYPFGVWNTIQKTEVAKALMFDEKIKVYQDFDYIIRMLLSGCKYSFAAEAKEDYFYRRGHEGTITSNYISKGKYESTKYLLDKTMKSITGCFGDSGRADRYKKAFRKFFDLQVERVAIDGSREQMDDFYSFYCANYTGRRSLRFRMLYRMVLSKAKEKQVPSKKLRFYIYLFLKPGDIFGVLKSKLRG